MKRQRRLWQGDELVQCTPEDAIDRLTLVDLEDKPFIEGLLWLIKGRGERSEIPAELQLRIVGRIWALREVEKRELEVKKRKLEVEKHKQEILNNLHELPPMPTQYE